MSTDIRSPCNAANGKAETLRGVGHNDEHNDTAEHIADTHGRPQLRQSPNPLLVQIHCGPAAQQQTVNVPWLDKLERGTTSNERERRTISSDDSLALPTRISEKMSGPRRLSVCHWHTRR